LNAVALRAAFVMPTMVGSSPTTWVCIHVLASRGMKDVDGRAKPDHDGGEG
jgi:hypothetical protein